MTRDDVLKEFYRPYQSHEDVGGPDDEAMADEIVRLREQLQQQAVELQQQAVDLQQERERLTAVEAERDELRESYEEMQGRCAFLVTRYDVHKQAADAVVAENKRMADILAALRDPSDEIMLSAWGEEGKPTEFALKMRTALARTIIRAAVAAAEKEVGDGRVC